MTFERRTTSSRSGWRGFTFVELCIAMVITSLVMAALASFALAMARSWQQAEQTQAISVRARQASNRLGKTVQDAKLIGAVSSGAIDTNPITPAAVILWIEDVNEDGAIQGAECAMFEHDPLAKTVRFYPPGQGDPNTALSWSVFTSQAVLTNFRAGRDFQVIAGAVERARFAAHHVSDPPRHPTLEYTLKLSDRGDVAARVAQEMIEYGTSVVRAPAKQPA